MRRIFASNGVVYYRSDLIPCPHGFSTRIGGISTAPHTASLNLAYGRGDSEETVQENLRRFGAALGFRAEQVVSVPQIHSAIVRYVTEENCGEGVFISAQRECDGYVSDRPQVVLGVKTADCVPILLYAPPTSKDFRGGIAALHAGWRGTAADIVGEGLRQLTGLGADPQTVRAAIGPSISSCCYTVREDFVEEFRCMAGNDLCDRFVRPVDGAQGQWRVNLKAVNRERLLQHGIQAAHIDVCPLCTSCMPHEFYSHRYSGGIRGTMLSVIFLNQERN